MGMLSHLCDISYILETMYVYSSWVVGRTSSVSCEFFLALFADIRRFIATNQHFAIFSNSSVLSHNIQSKILHTPKSLSCVRFLCIALLDIPNFTMSKSCC